jgi:F-type H+-transporting ATPase subunit g
MINIYCSSVSTFQQYFQNFVKSFRNPGALFQQASKTGGNPQSMISSIRNVNSQQLASGAVIFAEVLGFFTVGEMIGRMKLVGYRGDVGHHH